MWPERSGNQGVRAARDARRAASVDDEADASEAPPVTGAWLPGDPPGHRQFFTFATDRRFALESGAALTDVTVAYETWGTLDDDASQRRAALPRLDRRQPRRRAGRARPPDAGLVGGDGRSGPADRHRPLVRRLPQRARRLPGHDRPGVAAPRRRPAVRLAVPGHHDPRHGARPGPARRPPRHRTLARRRSAARWAGCRCSSGRSCTRTGCARSSRSPRACRRRRSRSRGARSAGGRSRLDPRWRGGDYYDAEPGDGPDEGLAIARMVAQVTFRSDNVFTDRFGRDLADRARGDTFGLWQQFEVERYLEHHGAKLGPPLRRQQLPRRSARRWTSTTSPAAAAASPAAMARITGAGAGRSASRRTCSTRTTSSARSTSCCAPRASRSRYVEIDSPHGHDAFLINLDQLADPIADFLDQMSER